MTEYRSSFITAQGEILENNNGVPTVAGWHDDPENPDYIRYSNGRSWTGQRVAKDRTLTLKNDNVYRPGGGVGRIPEQAEQVAPPAPVEYQPLTRRERRQLEGSGTPEIEQISDMFESDFEFHSAPKALSYAPAANELKEKPKVIHEGFDLSEMDPVEAEAPVASAVSFFDTNDEDWAADEAESVSTLKAPEDDEDDDETALPSLDFDGFSGGFTPVDKDDEGGETSSLPSLGESSSTDSDLPTFPSNEVEADADESPAEEEFFFGKDSDEPIEEEDEFASALVQRHSYEAPPAPPKEDAAKEESDEEAPSLTSAPSPVFSTPMPAYIAPEEDDDEAFDVTFKSSDAEGLIADESGDEDDEPGFGFQSKLKRSFGGDEERVAESSVPEKKEVPATKAEEATVPAHIDEHDEDEDGDDEAPSGFGGKFKSLFGKGRSKQPVLDYEYAGEDDEDNDEEAVAESPSKSTVEPVVELTVETVAKPVLESVKKPVEEPDEPVEVEAVEDADEEPQLKTGLFSSRQAKEDAAVEVELIDRLKDLAARVASLKEDEKQTLARVDAAKAQEAKLKQMILQAHEEHELLDQLAKARQKEIDGTHAAKEDDSFMDFLDSHTSPAEAHETADQEPSPEQENTVALPVVSHHEGDKEEVSDEASSSLPELKFN